MFYYSWVLSNSATAGNANGSTLPSQFNFAFANTKGVRLKYGLCTVGRYQGANTSGPCSVEINLSINLGLVPIVANPPIIQNPTNGGSLALSGLTINFDHHNALEVDVFIPSAFTFDIAFAFYGFPNLTALSLQTLLTLGFDNVEEVSNDREKLEPKEVYDKILFPERQKLFPEKNPTRPVRPRE